MVPARRASWIRSAEFGPGGTPTGGPDGGGDPVSPGWALPVGGGDAGSDVGGDELSWTPVGGGWLLGVAGVAVWQAATTTASNDWRQTPLRDRSGSSSWDRDRQMAPLGREAWWLTKSASSHRFLLEMFGRGQTAEARHQQRPILGQHRFAILFAAGHHAQN
jgi:hypothetical protein